jgi:hypothetical protein
MNLQKMLYSFLTLQSLSFNIEGKSISSNVIEGKIPVSQPIQYTITFKNLWSSTDHPIDYPSNAHWSPPIFVAHNENFQMWATNTEASPGVKSVAEVGSLTTINREINEAGNDVFDSVTGKGQFNSVVQEQVISGLHMNRDNTYISSLSMIAPSPDWFSGFHDFVPVSDEGTWYQSFTLILPPFDAGTDSGKSYMSANDPTKPKEKVSIIDDEKSVLAKQGKVNPVLEVKFELVTLCDESKCRTGKKGKTPDWKKNCIKNKKLKMLCAGCKECNRCEPKKKKCRKAKGWKKKCKTLECVGCVQCSAQARSRRGLKTMNFSRHI